MPQPPRKGPKVAATVFDVMNKARAAESVEPAAAPAGPLPTPQPTELEAAPLDTATASAAPITDYSKIDGRRLRPTERVVFSTRILTTTHSEIKRLSATGGRTMGEIIEEAIADFSRKKA